MERFHILETIHPVLKLTPAKELLLRESEKVLNWYKLLYLEHSPVAWQVYLLVLCNGCGHDEVAAVATRLGFSKRLEQDFLSLFGQTKDTAQRLMPWGRKKSDPASGAHRVLRNLPVEGVLFLMARSRKEPIRKLISLHLSSMRDMRIKITGNDLVKTLNIPPGPRIGEILHKVLDARIDGLAPDKKRRWLLPGALPGRGDSGRAAACPSSGGV